MYSCFSRYVQLSSLTALQGWVSHTDIQNFEILLCIGNKVDLVPDHPVHVEYRRRLLKLEDSSANEFSEYGISESEGTSLLGSEEPSWDIRKSCLEWCAEHNIEFIEACASNADFDKCITSLPFILIWFIAVLHIIFFFYIDLVQFRYMYKLIS